MTLADAIPTPLDLAFAAMDADPDDDSARLRYYARLSDGMLFLLLDKEIDGGTICPRIFETEDGPVVLAFDLEERLAEAAGAVAEYVQLPGRVIAQQLAGQGVALGINLGVAASGFLVHHEALGWLSSVLDHAPDLAEARPEEFSRPVGLPDALLSSLDAKLARAGGLARAALLSGVRYSGGRSGHMLAFLDVAVGAEAALARAVAEALTFSGLDAGEIDVTFLLSSDEAARTMARVALRFDLAPEKAEPARSPRAPGSDPDRPPKLR